MIWLVASVLGANGIWLAFTAYELQSWWYGLYAPAYLLAAIGLATSLRALRWLVYIALIGPVVSWIWLSAEYYLGGEWIYETTLINILRLVPGLLMVLFCMSATILVHRHFRTSRDRSSE